MYGTRYTNAIHFASLAHNGQKRKYTGEPYIVHPIEVATTLARYNAHKDLVIAGLLHDIEEDTEYGLHQIWQHFGESVARLVHFVSDISTPGSGNRAYRKTIYRKHIASGPPAAHTLKIADCLSNGKNIMQHDPQFAMTYFHEIQLLIDEALFNGDSLLLERLKNLVTKHEQTTA